MTQKEIYHSIMQLENELWNDSFTKINRKIHQKIIDQIWEFNEIELWEKIQVILHQQIVRGLNESKTNL